MPNRWIEHVKQFAQEKNISYACAMTDPDLKKGYVATGDKKRKPEKLEMAVPSTEPKAKAITIKARPAGAGAEKSLYSGMTEKEASLTKALKKYYETRDDDFERYVKLDKNGDIKDDNKKAIKQLTDDLAIEFKLPKTWLKQADKVEEKYGLGFGNNPNKESKDYYKIMFYRTKY